MEGCKINFKHSFNNGSGNKPESNQQQTSLNQGNNFNVSQQNYQQNRPNQNYNPVTFGQVGQNISQQQYSPTRNIGLQQYQQQNVNQQYSPNVNNWGQQNNQQISTMQENSQQLLGQETQPQTIAERIANMQNRTSIKPSDFLNSPIDPNIKVGIGQNMNMEYQGHLIYLMISSKKELIAKNIKQILKKFNVNVKIVQRK